MNTQTIDKLKQFQYILKRCILDRFNKDLPQEKITKLNNTNYINVDELKGFTSPLDIQGRILKNMLHDILTIVCKKDLQIGSETKTIDYGQLLEELLVEHFAIEISGRYKFQINSDESLRKKLTIINELKNILGAKFDNLVLNKNAKDILSMDSLKSIEAVFDVNAIDEYNNKELNKVEQSNSNQNSNQVNMSDFINNSISSQSASATIQNADYEELVMRYARGEKLSDEELRTLLKSTPDLMNDSQIEEFANNNSSPKLEMVNSSSGFSYFKMTIYFIIITNILGFIIATLLTHY